MSDHKTVDRSRAQDLLQASEEALTSQPREPACNKEDPLDSTRGSTSDASSRWISKSRQKLPCCLSRRGLRYQSRRLRG
jgi:hypothetical protein